MADSIEAAEKRHALRAYGQRSSGAELFFPLFGKHKSAQYLAALSAVQAVLGQINDDAVANRFLDELALAHSLSSYQDGLRWPGSGLARDLSQQLGMLQNAVGDFQKQQRYWINRFGV